jgi:hypothetical protein
MHIVELTSGCNVHRLAQTEKMLGRAPEEISAVVGYGAGMGTGPDGKVCYYYSDPR